jgi:putative transposase
MNQPRATPWGRGTVSHLASPVRAKAVVCEPMSQSLAKVLVHLVFSVKNRRPLLREHVHDELRAYLAGILRNHESPALEIGVVEDHVHILFRLSRNLAIATIVEQVKKSSSKWIKTQGPAFATFAWQNGYGAFSVSQSTASSTRRYIAAQREHHRRVSFQDEFRRFLEKYQVEHDERYLWD